MCLNILELTLDELTQTLDRYFNKGAYHASAWFKEVFKKGNRHPFDTVEFKGSPALTETIKPLIEFSPGKIIDTVQDKELLKFITRLNDGFEIESVIIPMANHYTLCVSSQVGCKMGCKFCETGRMGFKRNLTVTEITGQLFNARHILKKNVKNIVFMGMGEPFDNFDHVIQSIRVMNEQKGFDIALRHITVSTAGLVSGINNLVKMGLTGIRLAISINAPSDEVRSGLMPINRSISMTTLKQALLNYPLPKRGAFLFEYILIKGVNDSDRAARQLAEYIRPLKVRLNLIAYNPVNGFAHPSPSDSDLHRFADIMTRMGVFVIKRWGKGCSVGAGCGQLARGI